jgi:hypothetical protein
MPSAGSEPPLCALDWRHQYRVVPSAFGAINFFEHLADPSLMDALFHVEALTNDRLRDQVGDIALVDAGDRISGPGSSPVMAAFTHVGLPSRFSDGSFGIYNAAKTLKTAVAETKYHRAQFLAYTREAPGEIEMRVYVGEAVKPLHDVRGEGYAHLHDPDDWRPSQGFGKGTRAASSWRRVHCSHPPSSGQHPEAGSTPLLCLGRHPDCHGLREAAVSRLMRPCSAQRKAPRGTSGGLSESGIVQPTRGALPGRETPPMATGAFRRERFRSKL